MDIRFQGAHRHIACLFVFTHEPLRLFLGDHFAAAWFHAGHLGQPAKPLQNATDSLVIFNWHHW
jgi:hypothetical protein